MLQGSPRPGLAASELTRLLAHLSGTPPTGTRPAFAERLGQWLGWADAIALSAALNASPVASPGRGPRGVGPEEGDVARVRIALEASIAGGPREPEADPGDFGPHRRHCHAIQHAMHEAVAALRQRLRDALVLRCAEGARLAAIDAVMDRALAAREHGLLGEVPRRLQTHFERLQRAAAEGGAAHATAAPPSREPRWLAAFRDDMTRVLRAELAHRLLPAQGLLDMLRTHRPPT